MLIRMMQTMADFLERYGHHILVWFTIVALIAGLLKSVGLAL